MQANYRQFALLADNEQIFTRVEYGNAQVELFKVNLFKEKKLVLVLDLDHTLIHAMDTPLNRKNDKRFREDGIHLRDGELSKYLIWTATFCYNVKIRPFCAEFLDDLYQDFDITFFTAASKTYAKLIMKVLRAEMERKVGHKHDSITFKRQQDKMFDLNKLITRDDKARFGT